MKSPFDIIVSDEDSAIQYLIALALSPYCYHIDDDPMEVVWEHPITEDQLVRLQQNTATACLLLDRHTGIINDGAWIIYSATLFVAGKSD